MADHRCVTALIPAAGGSRRYNDAGYAGTKALLTVEYNHVHLPMIQHVIQTIPPIVERVIVGCRGEDVAAFYDVCETVPITGSVGQADTLLQMLEHVEEGQVLIVNCDALLPKHILECLLLLTSEHNSVATVVCDVSFPNWSYVDSIICPSKFVEKPRPQGAWRWGMAGAWAFRSSKDLRTALKMVVEDFKADPISSGEVYLSTALNHIPGQKHAVMTRLEYVVDWNTPEALVASGGRIL